MRLATYRYAGVEHPGVIADGRAFPLARGLSVRDVVDRGLDAARELGARAIASGGGVPLARSA